MLCEVEGATTEEDIQVNIETVLILALITVATISLVIWLHDRRTLEHMNEYERHLKELSRPSYTSIPRAKYKCAREGCENYAAYAGAEYCGALCSEQRRTPKR